MKSLILKAVSIVIFILVFSACGTNRFIIKFKQCDENDTIEQNCKATTLDVTSDGSVF